MDKLKLEFNRPAEAALKFAKGKRGESTIPGKGDWFMFSLVSGQVLFIDSDDCQDPDEMFAAANIGARDPFTITLRKSRQGARYLEVHALADAQEPALDPARYPDAAGTFEAPSRLEAQLAASIPYAQQRKAATPSKITPSAAVATNAAPTRVATPTPINATAQAQQGTRASNAMAGALIASVDAALIAQAYAADLGFQLHFSPEDVRAIAATIFIQASKDPGFLASGSGASGGATWRQ